MTDIAAIASCAILAGLALFQLALICGAPIGRFAWGGGHTVLPAKLRVGSLISILLYALFAGTILSGAGLVPSVLPEGVVNGLMWVMTGYFFVGIIMNALSRSVPERSTMTPVAATLAGLFLFVTLQ